MDTHRQRRGAKQFALEGALSANARPENISVLSILNPVPLTLHKSLVTPSPYTDTNSDIFKNVANCRN